MDVVRSRARRILGHLPRYRDLSDETTAAPARVHRVPLRRGEIPLGVYENVSGECEDSVLVTTLGLHSYRPGVWDSVGYEDIQSIERLPIAIPSDKMRIDGLTLHLVSGRSVDIPVRGGDGKLRDGWEVLRFLARVTDDLRRDRQQGRPHLAARG